MLKKTTAILQDSITQNQREVTLEPLTNYNIVVLDQQLKNNSSITFLNTSVNRNSNFRNAIVSTLNLDYRTKKNNYRIEGSILRSDIKENGNSIDGYKTTFKINKTKGNFRWMTGVWTTDENYNQDDMGISRWYNNQNIFANISYEIFNPTKYFNQFEFKTRILIPMYYLRVKMINTISNHRLIYNFNYRFLNLFHNVRLMMLL